MNLERKLSRSRYQIVSENYSTKANVAGTSCIIKPDLRPSLNSDNLSIATTFFWVHRLVFVQKFDVQGVTLLCAVVGKKRDVQLNLNIHYIHLEMPVPTPLPNEDGREGIEANTDEDHESQYEPNQSSCNSLTSSLFLCFSTWLKSR